MALLLGDLEPLVSVLRGQGWTVVGPTVRDGAIVLAELDSAADLPYGWGVEVSARREGGDFIVTGRADGAYARRREATLIIAVNCTERTATCKSTLLRMVAGLEIRRVPKWRAHDRSRKPPGYSGWSRYSDANPQHCPVGSATGSPWGARSCGNPGCPFSTNHCPIWTRS